MRRVLTVGLSLLVSAAALFFTFWRVEHGPSGWTVEGRFALADLEAALRGVRVGWLAASAALACVSLVPRAFELQAATRGRPRLLAAWHAVAIGMLVQNLLPARLGEAARPAVLARAGRVPVARAVAGTVVSRVLDLVALLAVACTPALLLAPRGAGLGRSLRMTVLAGAMLAAGLLGGLFFAWRRRRWVVRWARRHPSRLRRATAGFVLGLGPLADPPRFALALACALAAPLLLAASYGAALEAFGLGALPAGSSLFLVAAVLLASAVPAGPSSLGVYDAAVVWVVTALGAPAAVAAAFALATHALGALAYVLVGLASLVPLGARL